MRKRIKPSQEDLVDWSEVPLPRLLPLSLAIKKTSRKINIFEPGMASCRTYEVLFKVTKEREHRYKELRI